MLLVVVGILVAHSYYDLHELSNGLSKFGLSYVIGPDLSFFLKYVDRPNPSIPLNPLPMTFYFSGTFPELETARAVDWWRVAYLEIAEGLAITAIGILVVPAFWRKITEHDLKVKLPRALRDAALLSGSCFALVWIVRAEIWLNMFASLFHSLSVVDSLTYGIITLDLFTSACLCFLVYGLTHGLWKSASNVVRLFALPSVFLFTLGLMFWDWHEMPLYAVTFLSRYELNEVPLVSNLLPSGPDSIRLTIGPAQEVAGGLNLQMTEEQVLAVHSRETTPLSAVLPLFAGKVSRLSLFGSGRTRAAAAAIPKGGSR